MVITLQGQDSFDRGFEAGKRIKDKQLVTLKKQNTALREALQRIVDDCDLPYEAYGKLERKAIANARAALGMI